MSEKISRRDFLKLTAMGAAATAVMTGCGPMSRYVVRRPYTQMPEYNQTGQSTYYASTCRECPAGCGIIVRTREGRAITIAGNPEHPVNRGRLCARGLTAQQGLYNPDRIRGPRFQGRGNPATPARDLTWDEAVQVVTKALQKPPQRIAFLLGLAPDHLFDLVSELTQALGAPPPVRYSALAALEGRTTLIEAVRRLFGRSALPYFDLAQAEVTLAFGADFLQTWLSPVTYTRAYGAMRQGNPRRRGELIVFEPRQSLTAGNADRWVPLIPGSEAYVILGLGQRVAQLRGLPVPEAFRAVGLDEAAQVSGIPLEQLEALAQTFAGAERPLALVGGGALTQPNGLVTAQAVLALNALVGNLGQPGGVFLSPTDAAPAPLAEVRALVERMQAGEVDVLFIHGVNPLFELPAALGFEAALAKVPQVINFASFPDETALKSDYLFPDHSPLESFGYQRALPGSDRPAWSALQPVVVPLYDTRATVDVLLAAAQASGHALPYQDEVDFIQQKILPLLNAGGFYTAPEILTFWSRWLQYGGWWTPETGLSAPSLERLPASFGTLTPPTPPAAGAFYLLTYANHLGDGSGANRPWLQELPDAMTTVTWNSWVEIHPHTADELGLKDDDVVRITTPFGSVEASVYRYPAIRPDTIAIPFGQGHTALGRWAEGRGCNPAQTLPSTSNAAGDLAFIGTTATLTPTGQRRPLARVESKEGVYGKH